MPRHPRFYDRSVPANPEPPTRRVLDPVCEMTFTPGGAHGGRLQYGATTYFFCSHMCRARFEAAPARFAPEPPAAPVPRSPSEVLHTFLDRLHLLASPALAGGVS